MNENLAMCMMKPTEPPGSVSCMRLCWPERTVAWKKGGAACVCMKLGKVP